MDLALNSLQWLICHKTKPNQYPKIKFAIEHYFKELQFLDIIVKNEN